MVQRIPARLQARPGTPNCISFTTRDGLNAETGEAVVKDQLDIARRALVRIASDHEVTKSGFRRNLTRTAAINIAREACVALGWQFGANAKLWNEGGDGSK